MLNVIQKHQTFCTEIGSEIPFSKLPSVKFEIFVDSFTNIQNHLAQQREKRRIKIEQDFPEKNKFEKSIYRREYGDLAFSDIEIKYYRKLKEEIHESCIIFLWALMELGRGSYFCEQLELCEKEAANEANTFGIDEIATRLLYNRNSMSSIYSALLKCGQITLIKLIPPSYVKDQ